MPVFWWVRTWGAGEVWCGVVWCGAVWCGVFFLYVVWCGVYRTSPWRPTTALEADEVDRQLSDIQANRATKGVAQERSWAVHYTQ